MLLYSARDSSLCSWPSPLERTPCDQGSPDPVLGSSRELPSISPKSSNARPDVLLCSLGPLLESIEERVRRGRRAGTSSSVSRVLAKLTLGGGALSRLRVLRTLFLGLPSSWRCKSSISLAGKVTSPSSDSDCLRAAVKAWPALYW